MTSEPLHKPTATVEQPLDQQIIMHIIHQNKIENIRNCNIADEVVAFCTNSRAEHFVANGSGNNQHA